MVYEWGGQALEKNKHSLHTQTTKWSDLEEVIN